MKRWGRWALDESRMELIHDAGLRRVDLHRCEGPLEIASLIFHLADKDPDDQTDEDIGNLVRALRALFPVRDWIEGSLNKQRTELRSVTLTAEERARLH